MWRDSILSSQVSAIGNGAFLRMDEQRLALWVSSQGWGHRHWSNMDCSTCMTYQRDKQLPVYNIFLCICMLLNQLLDKLKE